MKQALKKDHLDLHQSGFFVSPLNLLDPFFRSNYGHYKILFQDYGRFIHIVLLVILNRILFLISPIFLMFL